MNISIAPGKYILAVSGGVDSVVLLDILAKQAQSLEPRAQSRKESSDSSQLPALGSRLIIAHFNHGIREESGRDEEFVKELSSKYGLVFQSGHANLGSNASEEEARVARYAFLNSVKALYKADAIITAHHEDDLIETAFINILRGTRSRGLTAIASSHITRPLLNVPKSEILKYAKEHSLSWREDSTNQDTKFLRNYLRQEVLPKLKPQDRANLLSDIEKTIKTRDETDNIITTISQNIMQDNNINRGKFALLPSEVGNELIAYWLRGHKVADMDKGTVESLSRSLKTALPGTKASIRKNLNLEIEKKTAHFAYT